MGRTQIIILSTLGILTKTATMPPSDDPSACAECGKAFGCMSSGTACDNRNKCDKILCSTCGSKYALLVFDSSNPKDSNDLSKNKTVKSFCHSCFEEMSVLDFTKSSQVIEPPTTTTTTDGSNDNKKPFNGITLIMAHGGGGSRAMFIPHARLLAERGYRCILFDFPGHGTLVDKPLSPQTCSERVKEILNEYNLVGENSKNIYVGGSLGAYVGFQVLKDCQEHFKGAIMLDCGQNVGPSASVKARMGLWFLQHLTQNISNKSMTSMMISATDNSPADWCLVESTFGAGFRFDKGLQQVECLKQVAPEEIIPLLKNIPMLFMNGSADHRDSEEKWLELCPQKEISELKVYQGGDHFFSHDSRFVDDIINRFDKFCQKAMESK